MSVGSPRAWVTRAALKCVGRPNRVCCAAQRPGAGAPFWSRALSTAGLGDLGGFGRWGFKPREEVLDILEADLRVSQQMSFSAMMPLNRLNVTREDVEEGALLAYHHVADMFAEGKWAETQYRTHHVMDDGLAAQFTKQSAAFKALGVQPQLVLDGVRARLLYSLVTFDELAPDFKHSWGVQIFGNNGVGRSIALAQSYVDKVRTSQPICVQLFVHFRGKENLQFRRIDCSGDTTGPQGNARGEERGRANQRTWRHVDRQNAPYMRACVHVCVHERTTQAHALTRTSVRAATDRRPTMATRCQSRVWAQAMQATMYGHSKPRSPGMTFSTCCMMRYIRNNPSHCLCCVHARVCFPTHTRFRGQGLGVGG